MMAACVRLTGLGQHAKTIQGPALVHVRYVTVMDPQNSTATSVPITLIWIPMVSAFVLKGGLGVRVVRIRAAATRSVE